jgi:hypothetical protein
VPVLQIVRRFPKFLSDGVAPIDHTAFRLHNAKLPPDIGREGVGESQSKWGSSQGWNYRMGIRRLACGAGGLARQAGIQFCGGTSPRTGRSDFLRIALPLRWRFGASCSESLCQLRSYRKLSIIEEMPSAKPGANRS